MGTRAAGPGRIVAEWLIATSRARDEMFLATDTSWAPWYIIPSDKRRARLNALTHILSKIPYEEPPRAKVKLPKRQERDDYQESDYAFRVIPEIF